MRDCGSAPNRYQPMKLLDVDSLPHQIGDATLQAEPVDTSLCQEGRAT